MISSRLKIGVLVIFQLTPLTLSSLAGPLSGKVYNLSAEVRAKLIISSVIFPTSFRKTKESMFTDKQKGSNVTMFQIRLLRCNRNFLLIA